MKYVYEFTNKRKLTKREFIQWFQRKFLYTIKKFNMIKKGDIVGYENKGDFRGVVLENLFEIYAQKAPVSVIEVKDKVPGKAKIKAITSTTDTEADKMIHFIIKGKSKDLKKSSPVESGGKIIKPLYLFLDKEVLLYAKLMELKFKKTEIKKDKISEFIDSLEKNHPEVKNSVISSYVELFS